MMQLIQKVSGKVTVTGAEGVSFCEEYDVAVAGLGVAGAISAVTSAGKNLKTLGIERLNAPGGTMTTGGVNGYYFGGSGGIFERIDERVREKCALVTPPAFENPDLRKHILDAAIADSGAHTLYESVITGLYADGRRIAGIRVCSGGAERDIAVRVLIDATGDGDICDMAGCSMDFGRESDGSVMPFTIVKSYMHGGRLERTNYDCGKVDHRNVSAYSRAILEANATFAQRGADERMVRLQPLPGIREGRLLNGEKKIKLENFLNGIYDDDPVMYAYADLDKHGADTAFDSDLYRKWHILSNLGALNISVPVPLGCLIAREYDNLLAAGRCLSVDHEMLTCIRMSRDMQKIGEIAAIAAYVSITDHVPLKDIKYGRVLPFLKETGCFSEANNRGFWYDGGSDESYKRKAEWITDPAQINESLSTLKPGVAIWSCRLLGGKVKPALISNLESKDENLRKHSALALAVMDDPAGAAVLRGMVAERDRTALLDMRKQNKHRIAMAICALGMLRDEESIDLIMDVIADDKEHTMYPRTDGFAEAYYRTLSCAVAALFDILKAFPARREEVEQFLEQEFSSLAYIKKITPLGQYASEYVVAKGIYEQICLWRERR